MQRPGNEEAQVTQPRTTMQFLVPWVGGGGRGVNQDSSHMEASQRSRMHKLIAWLGLGSHRSAEAGGLPLSRLSEQKPLRPTPAVAGSR